MEFGHFDEFGAGIYSAISQCIDHGVEDGNSGPPPITLAVEEIGFDAVGEHDENQWAHVSLTVYRNRCEKPTQFQIGVVNLMVDQPIEGLLVRWWAFPVA